MRESPVHPSSWPLFHSLSKEDGKYEFKLFDYKSNEWTIVTIDDYLPCVAGALKERVSRDIS